MGKCSKTKKYSGQNLQNLGQLDENKVERRDKWERRHRGLKRKK